MQVLRCKVIRVEFSSKNNRNAVNTNLSKSGLSGPCPLVEKGIDKTLKAEGCCNFDKWNKHAKRLDRLRILPQAAGFRYLTADSATGASSCENMHFKNRLVYSWKIADPV